MSREHLQPVHTGKYQLVRKLASGGMAEVFLAKAAGPGGFEKTLVLKRILPHLAEDPDFVQMFLDEAKLAARLEHPNIVQVFDFGELDGAYFLAMEFIDGHTLRRLVKHGVEQPLPPALCAKLIASAAEGLAYAHEYRDPDTGALLGLVHRDVSPANILVSRQGAVKVVDFGIAKAAGQGHRTQTGVLKGKVAYMPPEQLQLKSLDRRVDVYALGMVLYELLTGRRPFSATSQEGVVQAVLFDPFIPAEQRRPDVPVALLKVLDRALAKDREQRYPDCRALQHDLERFVLSTGEPVGAYQIAQLASQIPTESPSGPIATPATPMPRATKVERAAAPRAPEAPPREEGATRRATPRALEALKRDEVSTQRAAPRAASEASLQDEASTQRAAPRALEALTQDEASTQRAAPRAAAEAPLQDETSTQMESTASRMLRLRLRPSRAIMLALVGGGLVMAGPWNLLQGGGSAAPVPMASAPVPRGAGANVEPNAEHPVAPAGVAIAPGTEDARGAPAREPVAPADVATAPETGEPAGALAREPLRQDDVTDGVARVGGSTEAPPILQQAPPATPPTRRTPASARRGTGTLELRIWPYADVYVDGKWLGETPLRPFKLAEGRHTVKAVNPILGREVTSTVEVEAGKVTVFKHNFEDP